MRTLCLLVVVVCSGCGSGVSTPTFGRWAVTALTGSVTHVDSGAGCVGSWTWSQPNLASSWNGVKADFSGNLEYAFSFKGVAGSPSPDGFDHSAPAVGKSGKITGTSSRPDLSLTTTASGSYDGHTMTLNWTIEQHLASMVGDCKTDVTGSGTLTASAP